MANVLCYCLVLCRFMQFDISSYETSPEIYALEEKVTSLNHTCMSQSEQLFVNTVNDIKCIHM